MLRTKNNSDFRYLRERYQLAEEIYKQKISSPEPSKKTAIQRNISSKGAGNRKQIANCKWRKTSYTH